MNKTLKKTLSIILTIFMIVTAVPFAFAASDVHTYKTGDIVEFGIYPQSEVKEEALLAELNAIVPEWENWISYEYYAGTGDYGTMSPGDWMRYTDVSLNENKYRAVMFTEYRPFSTMFMSVNSNQDDNGYYKDTIYWFKYEPVKWRVLDPKEGLLMSETILDAQPFSNTLYMDRNGEYPKEYFSDAAFTNYANDWETSSLRKWLNNDFYNTAFNAAEKEKIDISVLDNKNEILEDITDLPANGGNDTRDKIFIISLSDSLKEEYGFDANDFVYDTAKKAKGSDYAKCQGLTVLKEEEIVNSEAIGYSPYFLRAPGYYSCVVSYIEYDGTVVISIGSDTAEFGVRPAIKLDPGSAKPCEPHTATAVSAKSPTCTQTGWEAYLICSAEGCEYSTYKEIPALEHKNEDGNGVCDNCDYVFTANCDHLCHKDGILGFFWKIISFLQRLFGIQQYCDCGEIHYDAPIFG